MFHAIHLGKDDGFEPLFLSDSSAYRDLQGFFITSSKSLSPKGWTFPRRNASRDMTICWVDERTRECMSSAFDVNGFTEMSRYMEILDPILTRWAPPSILQVGFWVVSWKAWGEGYFGKVMNEDKKQNLPAMESSELSVSSVYWILNRFSSGWWRRGQNSIFLWDLS